jgi:hypothetical protein
LFLLSSYFSVPTNLRRNLSSGSGTIESIKLKREAIPQSLKSFQKGHHDYYEIIIKEDKFIYKCFYAPNMKSLKSFGIEKLIGEKVVLRYSEQDTYRGIREIQFENVMIVNTRSIGFFPFLLFVGLTILFLCWGLWGFYIPYLVSDEKRNEILRD